MKKVLFALVAFFATTLGANAMSFEQAREQALFLTDKMAYELNLTDDQYEAAYEVNLDYLLGINSEADLYGVYWTNRNLDMSYILAEWQYRAFCDALYFYRPLYWGSGYWHFRIFARYPHRTFFYFGRPAFYHTYHGGHSWRNHGGSYYHGRTYGVAHRSGGNGRGMRDGYHGTNNHGGYNNHGNGGNNHGNGGNNHGSANRPESNRTNRGGNYGNGGRVDNNGNVRPSTNRGTGSNVDRTVTPSRERTYRNATTGSSTTTPSRSISNSGSMSRSVGNSGISTRSSSSMSSGSSSMGSMSRGGGFSGGSSRGGGFSGGSSRGGGSFGGGSHGGGSHGGRH